MRQWYVKVHARFDDEKPLIYRHLSKVVPENELLWNLAYAKAERQSASATIRNINLLGTILEVREEPLSASAQFLTPIPFIPLDAPIQVQLAQAKHGTMYLGAAAPVGTLEAELQALNKFFTHVKKNHGNYASLLVDYIFHPRTDPAIVSVLRTKPIHSRKRLEEERYKALEELEERLAGVTAGLISWITNVCYDSPEKAAQGTISVSNGDNDIVNMLSRDELVRVCSMEDGQKPFVDAFSKHSLKGILGPYYQPLYEPFRFDKHPDEPETFQES